MFPVSYLYRIRFQLESEDICIYICIYIYTYLYVHIAYIHIHIHIQIFATKFLHSVSVAGTRAVVLKVVVSRLPSSSAIWEKSRGQAMPKVHSETAQRGSAGCTSPAFRPLWALPTRRPMLRACLVLSAAVCCLAFLGIMPFYMGMYLRECIDWEVLIFKNYPVKILNDASAMRPQHFC